MTQQQSFIASERYPRLRILIPARGGSVRIPHKNLQDLVPGKSLLQWSVELYQRFLPGIPIHVATDCHQTSKLAVRLGCALHGRELGDIQDTRCGYEIMRDFHDCYPGDTILTVQCTSPFTFQSELLRALDNPLPFLYAAYTGAIHTCGDRSLKSQELPITTVVAGNFYLARQPFGDASIWRLPQFASSVSWLSAIDINNQDDLDLARVIARCVGHDDLCQ